MTLDIKNWLWKSDLGKAVVVKVLWGCLKFGKFAPFFWSVLSNVKTRTSRIVFQIFMNFSENLYFKPPLETWQPILKLRYYEEATKFSTKQLFLLSSQRYTYRVLQTIQMKLILLCVWAEPAILGSTKTALKFIYEI